MVGFGFVGGKRDEDKFPSLFLRALYLFECSCLLNLEYVEITNNPCILVYLEMCNKCHQNLCLKEICV